MTTTRKRSANSGVVRGDPLWAARHRPVTNAIEAPATGSAVRREFTALGAVLAHLDSFQDGASDIDSDARYAEVKRVVGQAPDGRPRQLLIESLNTLQPRDGAIGDATAAGLITYGDDLRRRGHYAVAAHCYDITIGIRDRVSDQSIIGLAYEGLAGCERILGHLTAAHRILADGISSAWRTRDMSVVARLTCALVRHLRGEGRIADAEVLIVKAVEHANNAADTDLMARAVFEWAILQQYRAVRAADPAERIRLWIATFRAYGQASPLIIDRVTRCRLMNDTGSAAITVGLVSEGQQLLAASYACAPGPDTEQHTIINQIDGANAVGDKEQSLYYVSLLAGARRLPPMLKANYIVHAAEAKVLCGQPVDYAKLRAADTIAREFGLDTIRDAVTYLRQGTSPPRPAPLHPVPQEIRDIVRVILAAAPAPARGRRRRRLQDRDRRRAA
jgi:hypothetical protein